MRVLILSQYYYPEPVPKAGELADALVARGHTVNVITGFPNYPEGKLYANYRLHLFQRETVNGVPIVRTFEYPYHGKSVPGRMLNYLSFMLSAPLGALFSRRADVIYVWHPPLTIGVAAWFIARIRRIPFVYDVQDIWPDSVVTSGLMKEGTAVTILRRLERFVYRQADHLLVVTEGARQNLIKKGVAPEKLTVIPHWIDERLFANNVTDSAREVRTKYEWDGCFVVMFAGNIGIVQGLDAVLEAFHLLRDETTIRFVMVGDGTDKARIQQLVREMDLTTQVQFIDSQPATRIPVFLEAADVLLVHLKRSELSRYVIPTKTLAYLAAGKPILMAMEGAAADLVQQAQAGILVTPGDSVAISEGIRKLHRLPSIEREALGDKGRSYLLEHLTKDIIIDRYETLLRCVAEAGIAKRNKNAIQS